MEARAASVAQDTCWVGRQGELTPAPAHLCYSQHCWRGRGRGRASRGGRRRHRVRRTTQSGGVSSSSSPRWGWGDGGSMSHFPGRCEQSRAQCHMHWFRGQAWAVLPTNSSPVPPGSSQWGRSAHCTVKVGEPQRWRGAAQGLKLQPLENRCQSQFWASAARIPLIFSWCSHLPIIMVSIYNEHS